MIYIAVATAQLLDLAGYLWATSLGAVEGNPLWTSADPMKVVLAKIAGLVIVLAILRIVRTQWLRLVGASVAIALGLVGFVSAILVVRGVT